MRLKPVLLDLAVLVITIPIVIALFKTLPLKEAALIAGGLFILVPAALMGRRLKHPFKNSAAKLIWWGGILIFWLGFAWPILIARLLNWNTEFGDLLIFGWPAPLWHQQANNAYRVMLVAILLAGFLESVKSKKAQ